MTLYTRGMANILTLKNIQFFTYWTYLTIIQGVYIRTDRMFPPNRNNTSYPLALSNILKGIAEDGTSHLQYHQQIIRDFVLGDPTSRGKLIFNEPGTGKTITAASISLKYREHRDVIVLSAKSLPVQLLVLPGLRVS